MNSKVRLCLSLILYVLIPSSYRKQSCIIALGMMRNSSATLGLSWWVFSSSAVFPMGRGVVQKEAVSVSQLKVPRNLASCKHMSVCTFALDWNLSSTVFRESVPSSWNPRRHDTLPQQRWVPSWRFRGFELWPGGPVPTARGLLRMWWKSDLGTSTTCQPALHWWCHRLIVPPPPSQNLHLINSLEIGRCSLNTLWSNQKTEHSFSSDPNQFANVRLYTPVKN